MYKILGLFLLLVSFPVSAQPLHYSVANAHSHNDYEQAVPFYLAYNQGFGSIEADIFLQDGVLLVSHDTAGLKKKRSLQDLYLKPLQSFVQKNQGYPYPDTSRQLQLLIDIKTEALPTLKRLVQELEEYPTLINTRLIKWVISGNRPPDSLYSSYPYFIEFDGVRNQNYNADALSKIVLISDNFRNYSKWDGTGKIPENDVRKLNELIQYAHLLKKPVRFWNAPDNINAWKQLMELGVDYINTDHIKPISDFLIEK